MLFNLNLKRKLQGTLIINNKSMDFFDLSSHRTPNFKLIKISKLFFSIQTNDHIRSKEGWHEKKTRKSFLGVGLARDLTNRSFNAISRLKRSKRIVGRRSRRRMCTVEWNNFLVSSTGHERGRTEANWSFTKFLGHSKKLLLWETGWIMVPGV